MNRLCHPSLPLLTQTDVLRTKRWVWIYYGIPSTAQFLKHTIIALPFVVGLGTVYSIAARMHDHLSVHQHFPRTFFERTSTLASYTGI